MLCYVLYCTDCLDWDLGCYLCSLPSCITEIPCKPRNQMIKPYVGTRTLKAVVIFTWTYRPWPQYFCKTLKETQQHSISQVALFKKDILKILERKEMKEYALKITEEDLRIAIKLDTF